MDRRTKVVATIGPACAGRDVLESMYRAGMDVVRLNLSHGSEANHRDAVRTVREVRERTEEPGRPLALMVDSRGPEIRVLPSAGTIDIRPGDMVALTADGCSQVPGADHVVCVNVPCLPSGLCRGSQVLIADGRMQLRVSDLGDGMILAEAVDAGTISGGNNVCFPGVVLDFPILSDSDQKDLRLSVASGAEWLALSLVRRAEDVLEARDYLHDIGSADTAVMAKIETAEAYEHLDHILAVSDGVMVARGDLGVEYPPEEIPMIQKDIIARCNAAAIPVVTATQMLESMTTSPTATRAEASDVANAILDGSDAVMLSGETAVGEYPRRTIEMMVRIIQRTEERWLGSRRPGEDVERFERDSIGEAVARAAVNMSYDLQADAIVTPTRSGYTSRMVARYRPRAKVVAVTTSEGISRRLAPVWGVLPVTHRHLTDDTASEVQRVALRVGAVSEGDLVIITGGTPGGPAGTTDTVMVRTLHSILVCGQGIGRGSATAAALVEDDAGILQPSDASGGVLVMRQWSCHFGPRAETAAAIVAEEGGLSSEAALVGLQLGIPVIVGAVGATAAIRAGAVVTVDAERGVVHSPAGGNRHSVQ